MNRRKLIIGGGAAALATGLAAVTGGRIPPAAASAGTTGSTSTVAHARQVLELLDVERGLVDPERVQNRFEEALAAYESSDPRDPNADDLAAWVRQRVANLIGEDSLEIGIEEPETRTLTAFGLLLFSQHQDVRIPPVAQSMPVPEELAKLEPDFFPELFRQVTIRSENSREFADLLHSGMTEIDRAAARSNGNTVNNVMFALFWITVITCLVVLSAKTVVKGQSLA